MADPGKAVFLSYASQDTEVARRICDALRAAGIEVWFDQSELRGGDAWDSAIRQQIKSCSLFLPVISRNTSARTEGYFRLEWKLGIDRSHLMSSSRAFLLPVAIDDTTSAAGNVPDRFRELQWISLPGGEVTPAFVERVARLIERRGIPDVEPRNAMRSGGAEAGGATPAAGTRPQRLPWRNVWIAAASLALLIGAGGN